MMNARDREIFATFCRKVRERFPDARIYAYGSRVRGDYQEDSDLDVCVVLAHYDSDSTQRRAISEIAWEVGFENDLLIQSVVFSVEAFDDFPGAANPLVEAILEEGIAT